MEALLHPAIEVSLLLVSSPHSYLTQITPMLHAPVELEAVATAGREKALLALVSPSKLARLRSRMSVASQSQSDPEEEEDGDAPDISGSDTGSDPEYVPPTGQLSDPDSDSSDEVCTHPVFYLSNLFLFSSPRLLLFPPCCLLTSSGPSWCPPRGLARLCWRRLCCLLSSSLLSTRY